jgi:hypothetical protein
MTKNYSSGQSGFQHQGGMVYTESHYWNIGGLTLGNTYKLSWKEIVLHLNNVTQCSNCLMGGWAIRTDAIQAPIPPATSVEVSYNHLNMATPLYDPIANNTLSYANFGYHQSNCNQNTSATATNTAGASNGSESIWHDRCAEFEATGSTMRIHFIAFTDFNLGGCTYCHDPNPPGSSSTRHGSYVGLSEVGLISGTC